MRHSSVEALGGYAVPCDQCGGRRFLPWSARYGTWELCPKCHGDGSLFIIAPRRSRRQQAARNLLRVVAVAGTILAIVIWYFAR